MSAALDTAYKFFIDKGYSSAQAAGIVGNLYGESKLNTKAVGDGGKAYGIGQWHPDRQAIFAKAFGKPIQQSTYTEQLAFVDYELRNNESLAGKLLRKTKTIAEATRVFMLRYERPAAWAAKESYGARYSAAQKAASRNGKEAVSGDWDWSDPLGSFGYGLGDAYADTFGDGSGSELFNPMSFFTSDLVKRIVAVIVGVVLVGLAIAAVTLTSDTTKNIINTIKPK
jgi:hypothetical protein